MSSEIVFYDIPGKSDETKAWSPNTWNIRYALNYKGLKYRTEWVEFPHIESVCKKIGAPATGTKADGVTPYYTLPVIFDPATNTAVADATTIADYLDKTYPSKLLFPPGTRGLFGAFDALSSSIVMSPLFLLVVLPTCHVLNPISFEYFYSTRTTLLGTLEEVAPDGAEKTEKLWNELEAGLAKTASWFKANGNTPFITGDAPSYADIQIAGRLVWAKVVWGKDSKNWSRLRDLDGGRWGKFLDQFDKYSAVDL
ncbi:hypothetical protein BXZ70DRAFT_1002005 [Cristinia sonorae]|uniref:GST N-terminal domain-containing protein n=1 Tax=Cristinia sonorae TaxID=1940300 RepID=A0A8K0UGP3_9AGAR|nr:hypothetical protein BXZ70DRAFT_1002005 [Cristinia sonorae]